MDTKFEYSVDILTPNGVTVKKQKYIEENGIREDIGMIHAKAYQNSATSREELVAEVPEPFLSGILAVWGEEPTVIEKNVMEDREEIING